jgi:bifunctional UDP-N-acetylglucosamine pyrophosphorylase/glucosamine-1-phosphate N-acetyltransferase
MSLTAIILAAGKSTRMKSRLPKVLHEVCGRPMLEHILLCCYQAGCERAIVVVGHGKDEVMARFAGDDRITWVDQTQQLGSGHAVMVCEPQLKELLADQPQPAKPTSGKTRNGQKRSKRGDSANAGDAAQADVMILAGDGPLIRTEILDTMLRAHHDDRASATLATSVLDDPTGYGRILRDRRGDFVHIVEEADANASQRKIREVFPNYSCFKVDQLLWALGKLTNDNAKGEYYLTDLFGILRKNRKKVVAVQAVAADEFSGVNTRQQLAEVDAIMQERIQRQLRESGVTIVSSSATYIEAGVTAGAETVIQPFSFIGRDSSIGPRCVIGPFACLPRQSLVKEGATIAGNISLAAEALNSGAGNAFFESVSEA